MKHQIGSLDDLGRLTLGRPCPVCERPIDAITLAGGADGPGSEDAGIAFHHHHRGERTACTVKPQGAPGQDRFE